MDTLWLNENTYMLDALLPLRVVIGHWFSADQVTHHQWLLAIWLLVPAEGRVC
jgi:hypothetical protein